jgi:hypothetical protein
MPTLAELTDAYLAGAAKLRTAVAGMTRFSGWTPPALVAPPSADPPA